MNQEENKKKISKKIPGCDLGTTNSAIAVFSSINNNIEVIANELGGRTTPSLIYFSPSGQIIVGENARKFMDTQPERVVYEVKRLLGRKYDDPSVQQFLKKCSYKIVCGKNGEALVKIDQKEYSPVQLSAFILQEMKKTFQNYFPEQPASEMIITVPAHFNDEQRQATKDAGIIAGLKVERIINEPTAAALAYGLDKSNKKETIAVFDLGGGTFDISIIEIDNGVFTVKSTNGDTWLGGSDFDTKLVEWLLNKTKLQLNVDLSKDNLALQRFKNEAIRAKHHLSQAESYEFNLTYLVFDEKTKAPLHLQTKILRREFNDLIKDLLQRMVKPCQECLRDAQLKEVDKVILVGGMTRVPAVQDLAKELFHQEANKSVNPDEAVAIGAAVQGSVLSGATEDILLLDVNPLSLGIETQGMINTKMIKRNTSIPTKFTQIFSTASDGQDAVTIKVIEGEGEMSYSSGNRVLGVFNLTGIKSAPKGIPQIEVEFSIDTNGILSVKAKDKDTNKEQKITITGRTRDEKEIEKMIKEAQEKEEEDKKLKENAELVIEADSFCYSIKKDLDNFAKNNLQEEVQYKELEKIHNELKASVNANDYEKLKQQLKESNITDTIIKLSNELREKQPKETKVDSEKEEDNSAEAVQPEENKKDEKNNNNE